MDYKAGLITDKEYEKACGSVLEVKQRERDRERWFAYLPITAAFDSIKEKAGGNCVLEEGEESGCYVEPMRGAPDEDGAAEFPE